jgi:tetrathionate reductase subunit B
MVIDLRRCFGCHGCSVACKAEQDVPLGCFKSWVTVSEKGRYPNVSRYFVPVLCNHCEKPPCAAACPTGATRRRKDGIVVVDDEKCIGCKYCIQACPYAARYVDPRTKVAQKCDFCVHRIEQGLLPACVNTCNARARIFGDLNDPASAVSRLLAENPVQVLRPALGSEPRVFYIGLDRDAYKPIRKQLSLSSK